MRLGTGEGLRGLRSLRYARFRAVSNGSGVAGGLFAW